ncbi:MAG TPA: RHS repeat-associated core domain-containing protein [Gemmatimonadales bacterium]|nr:RHS repeat-associated core domain-containing protein [Gemmatimonadales bacterium]
MHAAQSSVVDHKWSSFTWLSDSAHTQWVRYLFDAAGRDTALVHDWTVQTRYAYDRLGRLRARLPWADSAAVVDSFFYDIAGNAKKSIDRMGRTITTDYDSRNRDTASVIPGVGTVRKAYAGPLDQLTREWIASPVDSIGNVNGELRWGYDQRGRLKADTSYTGSTARATTHSYDRYERDSTFTDPLGTWNLRYDATRGVVDSLIAPWSDTVSYAYDAQWRVVGPAIRSGATIAATQVTPYWAANGDLDSLVHKVGSTARGKYAKRGTDGDSPGLVSTWVDPNGLTWQDSVVYDAWERATVHVLMEGGVAVTRDSLWFDRNGNVRTSGTAGVNETYDMVTNRLTSQVLGGVTWTLKYDRAGNLILRKAGSDSTRYFYDGLNRLRAVRRGAPSHPDSVMARYDYDVAGRRIVKRVYSAGTGGTVGYTRFGYRDGAVAFETDSGGTLGQRYLWGMGTDNLLALRTASGTEYYAVLDKLGSVRGMMLRDASGTVKLTITYGTYGAVVDSAGAGLGAGVTLRYRWTGREFDPETGFYYLRARYYDPAEKRFVQEDPAAFAGSNNLYAYANGDPLEATDPSGLMTSYKAMTDQANALAAYNNGLSDVSAGEWQLYDQVVAMESGLDQMDADRNSTEAGQGTECRPDKHGLCPGGLTPDQWGAVIRATSYLTPAARQQVLAALNSGRIQGTRWSSDPNEEAGVSPWHPTVIQLDTHQPLPWGGYASTFDLDPESLAHILAHEVRHVQQAAAMGRRDFFLCRGNSDCHKAMEDDAENYAYTNAIPHLYFEQP